RVRWPGHRFRQLARRFAEIDGFQVIDRNMSSDAPRPRSEGTAGIEPFAVTIDAPECLDGQFLRHRGIAHKTNYPSVYFALILPKQRLEGLDIAGRELLQRVHVCLRSRNPPRRPPAILIIAGAELASQSRLLIP